MKDGFTELINSVDDAQSHLILKVEILLVRNRV